MVAMLGPEDDDVTYTECSIALIFSTQLDRMALAAD
jgi:hypothetical protein